MPKRRRRNSQSQKQAASPVATSPHHVGSPSRTRKPMHPKQTRLQRLTAYWSGLTIPERRALVQMDKEDMVKHMEKKHVCSKHSRLVWEYCEHIKLAPDELGLMTVDLDDGERIITLDEAVITELEGEPLIELLHSLGLLEKFVVDNDEEDNELYAVGFKKCEICEFFGEVNAHVRLEIACFFAINKKHLAIIPATEDTQAAEANLAQKNSKHYTKTSAPNREGFECAVCLQLYFDPRSTPCHHTFCMPCIWGLLARRHPFCPLCRTQLPEIETCEEYPARTDIAKHIQITWPEEACQRAMEQQNAPVALPKAEESDDDDDLLDLSSWQEITEDSSSSENSDNESVNDDNDIDDNSSDNNSSDNGSSDEDSSNSISSSGDEGFQVYVPGFFDGEFLQALRRLPRSDVAEGTRDIPPARAHPHIVPAPRRAPHLPPAVPRTRQLTARTPRMQAPSRNMPVKNKTNRRNFR